MNKKETGYEIPVQYLKNRYKHTKNCDLSVALDIINQLQQEYIEFEERIDKAIQYLNNNHLYEYIYDKEELFEIVSDGKATNELLKILKGDNNE